MNDQSEIELYGKAAADWLARWDAGKAVWTIEMGGLGPGYEQCIHITAAEILRWLLANNINVEDMGDRDRWPAIRDQIDKAVTTLDAVSKLGLSGAQWGAAMRIGTSLYMRGPRQIMKDPSVKDRHIQVSKVFP